jgi:hypothetical protein
LLSINKNLTTINYVKGRSSKIEYIVIHYTGNNGDTAKNNTDYFKNVYRGASAHYFVDESSIWQCVEDNDVAWHCGTMGAYKHPSCRNGNSIGIELCSRKDSNGNYYFKPETVANAIGLTTYLMKKYKIPATNVIRHFDVVSKNCPAPFVEHPEQWTEFKSKLTLVPRGLYRVAEECKNGKYVNQKGAFAILDNAKRCCDLNKGTSVFDADGNKVYPKAFQPYCVVVDTPVLNVREKPNTSSKIVTQVKSNEVYTIIEEIGNWGRLKSKVGYICLDYTKKL